LKAYNIYAKIHIMYALNLDYIKKVAKSRGHAGIKPLLEHLGLHRNTLDRFARGASVLPSSIATVLSALDIPIEKATYKKSTYSELPINPLVLSIHKLYPDISIFLFGSRARGKARKYSDFDLGVYSNNGISLEDYLEMIEVKEQYEEESPYKIDCINLNNADRDFLVSIESELRMLVGFESDLIILRGKAHGE
jgi:predicted nucleotidyltransferase